MNKLKVIINGETNIHVPTYIVNGIDSGYTLFLSYIVDTALMYQNSKDCVELRISWEGDIPDVLQQVANLIVQRMVPEELDLNSMILLSDMYSRMEKGMLSIEVSSSNQCTASAYILELRTHTKIVFSVNDVKGILVLPDTLGDSTSLQPIFDYVIGHCKGHIDIESDPEFTFSSNKSIIPYDPKVEEELSDLINLARYIGYDVVERMPNKE